MYDQDFELCHGVLSYAFWWQLTSVYDEVVIGK